MNIQGNKPPEGQEISRSQVQNQKPAPSDQNTASAKAPKGGKADRVDISRAGKEAADLMAAIKQMPDVREDKVREIRESVESGAYTADPRKIAEKLLNEL